MTTIVALSDTHTLQDKVPMPEGEFDFLIHAGDMGNIGLYDEYRKIGEWFRKLKPQYKHQIIVPGNHDWGFMTDVDRIMADHFDPSVICLIDKAIELEGIKFYGCPWMPVFYNWAFMRKEVELPIYYQNIPDDTEILITHGPPYSVLDKERERCGSRALLNRVKELKHLKHHIFGHIHAGYGQETIGDLTFHNVSSLNANYRYQNPPQIIEIG